MKKYLLLIFISFYSTICLSQRQLPCFIGMNEKAVTNWLDSLNKLSTNPYYEIKRQTTDYGDLVLTCNYSLNEEKLYKCLAVRL